MAPTRRAVNTGKSQKKLFKKTQKNYACDPRGACPGQALRVMDHRGIRLGCALLTRIGKNSLDFSVSKKIYKIFVSLQFFITFTKPKQVKIIIEMENLIKYLNCRIEALTKRNKFLEEQLNICLTQLDLDNE